MTTRDLVVAAAGGTGVTPDDYFKNVSLLLQGDGTNGAQNNTFLDSSTNNFTITRNGNTTQGSFSPYGNLWSNYFDGSGDYLSTPSTGQFAPTGDFTIGCWFYTTSVSGFAGIIGNYTSNTSTDWVIDRSGTSLRFFTNGAGLQASTTIAANTWYYVAMVRSGSTITFYLNGSSVGSITQSGTFGSASKAIYIGVENDPTPAYYWTGYISNVLLVNGSAITSVPTAPSTAVSGTSLLTCQSNRFIDNSSNNFAITVNGNTSVQRFSPFNPTAPYSTSTIGGSGYFDGTGDYLNLASNTAFQFGTGDFTFETWVYCTQAASAQKAIYDLSSSNTAGSFALFSGGSDWTVRMDGLGNDLSYPVSASDFNNWVHFAVCKSGSTVTFYKNGISVASGSRPSINIIQQTPNIGRLAAFSGYDFGGYISNLRVVKGTAVYTSNFTPPTTPLTAITNTSLLCNFTNAGIPDAAMQNDIETVGNAQVSTSVKKYGTGSIALTGASDYLKGVANNSYAFGTGAFTIEAWIYPTNLSGNRTFYSGTVSSFLIVLTSTYIRIFENSTSTYKQYTVSIPTNTWSHFAVVRTGAVNPIVYVNGVAYTASGSYTGIYGLPEDIPEIGYDSSYPSDKFYGYIDDLRITKGYARYTANFTPPAQALPNQ